MLARIPWQADPGYQETESHESQRGTRPREESSLNREKDPRVVRPGFGVGVRHVAGAILSPNL